MVRDWFWLYRPAAPSARAQSVQVVSSARALAARGHRVELCVEGPDRDPARILDFYGLGPVDGLTLRILPHGTAGSLAYRWAFGRWVARTGGQGVALARRKRHAAWAERWFGGRYRLILEAHEVDSLQAPDPAAAEVARALEAAVLRRAWGVIANAEGTLALLRRAHPVLPPAIVIHNAARGAGLRADAGAGFGVVGSVRAYKDVDTVLRAAALVAPRRITWIGADHPLQPPLRSEPPIPPRDVPARLAAFDALILPLSPGLFGEELTSPLKLWDALASGVPLVAADTAAVRRAAPGAFVPYVPGDAASLADALRRASSDPALRASVLAAASLRARTWDQRAAEVEAFVDRVLG